MAKKPLETGAPEASAAKKTAARKTAAKKTASTTKKAAAAEKKPAADAASVEAYAFVVFRLLHAKQFLNLIQVSISY